MRSFGVLKLTTMELNLKRRAAIVTGASKGIGAGIALALAAEGVSVGVNYASIVVNNAGIHTYGPMEAITEEIFMQEVRTKVCNGPRWAGSDSRWTLPM